jgi:hypothetical protein
VAAIAAPERDGKRRSRESFNRLLKNWIGRSAGAFLRRIRPNLATMQKHRVFALSFPAQKFARHTSTASFSAAC